MAFEDACRANFMLSPYLVAIGPSPLGLLLRSSRIHLALNSPHR